MMMMMC